MGRSHARAEIPGLSTVSTGLPLIGVLIPGKAISFEQKRKPGGGGSFTVHLVIWRTHKQGLPKDWGQASDTTENKLQIHINLERKTNDKQKSIFAERPKSRAKGTKGAPSALQTLGACGCTGNASDANSKMHSSLLKSNDPLTGDCPTL